MKDVVLLSCLFSGVVALAASRSTEIDNSPLCYNSKSQVKLFAYFQELLLPQCEMKFPCAEMPATEMVACLETRASINFQLKTSENLQNFFAHQEDLQEMFVKDPVYKEAFKNLHLKSLFDGDAGVFEKYTLAQHTTRVLIVFESQTRFWAFEQLQEPIFVSDKLRFMKHLMAYHDIGKSIPAKIYEGDRRKILAAEIQYSYPIAWRVMLASKYSRAEATFAISLIATHKVIGDFLQRKIDLSTARSEIERYAQFSNVSPSVFLQYLEILFIADAGSYPGLEYSVFDHSEEGQMTIKDQTTYQTLKSSWPSL